MKHVVDMAWLKNMAFEAEVDGHKITLDAAKDSGGDDLGPRPKKLMLLALAGCTGIDVILILNKMKIFPETFNVVVEGELAEEHPKKYTSMKVVYQFKGKDLPIDKLKRAVELSETKYCGVRAVYQDALKIESEIRVSE